MRTFTERLGLIICVVTLWGALVVITKLAFIYFGG